jgi:hypothetical protein
LRNSYEEVKDEWTNKRMKYKRHSHLINSNSSYSKIIFTLQKKIVRTTSGAKPYTLYIYTYEIRDILLPLPYEYVFINDIRFE